MITTALVGAIILGILVGVVRELQRRAINRARLRHPSSRGAR